MDEDKQINPIKWIQTPFSYTGFSKNLSLFQQNILVKVSLHMQKYWENYWNTELKDSNSRPKPLMSDDDKEQMGTMRLWLHDLGLTSNNYSRIDKALKEILAITVDVPEKTDEGMVMVKYNIFSHGKTPIVSVKDGSNKDEKEVIYVDRRRGCIDLGLNPKVVDYVFDMSQGYVSHPENIARIGTAENMPQMYYLIKHYMNNWKKSSARIELMEMKDYLGMVRYDNDGNVEKVRYPKYAQFRLKVIKRAMDEMHELYLQGKIDKDFTWIEERERGKKTGDPKAIVFSLANIKKEKDLFTEIESEPEQAAEPKRSWVEAYVEQHGNPTTAKGQSAWDQLCGMIKDDVKRHVFQSVRVEKIMRKSLILYAKKQDIKVFEECFSNELDDKMRNWVFATVTRLAEREVNKITYHSI